MVERETRLFQGRFLFGVPNVNLPGPGGTQPPKTRFTETSVSCKPLLKCAGFYENSNEKNEGIP